MRVEIPEQKFFATVKMLFLKGLFGKNVLWILEITTLIFFFIYIDFFTLSVLQILEQFGIHKSAAILHKKNKTKTEQFAHFFVFQQMWKAY